MMRRLDNSIHQAGTQRIVWDGRDNFGTNVASGVYFCQVKFSGKAISKKLLLIK
jgi:flagellar hook assembly protein FlgD